MRSVALGDFYASLRKQCVISTHFEEDVLTTVKMTAAVETIATLPSTVAVSTTAPNGELVLTIPANDNQAALAHITAPINLTVGVCAVFAARVKFEDAGASVANLMIGLSDEVGLDQMQDNGAGIDASMHGAGFYAIDGSARLGVFHSNAATQTTNLLTKAASLTRADIDASYVDADGNAKYRSFEVEIKCKTTTKCDVTYKIDGVAVYQLLDQSYTDGTDVKGLVYLKSGSALGQVMTADAVLQGATFDDVA